MRRIPGLFVLVAALGGPASAEPLVLPFETGPGGSRILVKAEVFGRPVVLVLDTGSPQTMLRPELVRLPADSLPATRFSTEAPGLLAHGRWSVATLRLGPKTWPLRTVVAARFDAISEALGTPIDGILGQDLLREFHTVLIDFKARIVRLGPEDVPAKMTARE